MTEVKFHTDNLLITMDPGIPFQVLPMLESTQNYVIIQLSSSQIY